MSVNSGKSALLPLKCAWENDAAEFTGIAKKCDNLC